MSVFTLSGKNRQKLLQDLVKNNSAPSPPLIAAAIPVALCSLNVTIVEDAPAGVHDEQLLCEVHLQHTFEQHVSTATLWSRHQ